MFLKRFKLGLIHVAVAMTLLPINSALNRVMIKELGISAALVAAFVSLPYLFSPSQMLIGSYADHHPWWGRRRTPFILLGLFLCASGLILSPYAAFVLVDQWGLGLALCLLAFGAWGMGRNFAAVSYLSLASELSGREGRSRTIATMFFMMIVSIILTAFAISRLVDPYSPAALQRAFWLVGMVALVLGVIGLIRLEERFVPGAGVAPGRHSWTVLLQTVTNNRQATLFFCYLTLLLAAILAQDVLLEPFAAEAFGMPVRATTLITVIWGTCFLIALLAASALVRRWDKRSVARWGAWGALSGFVLIGLSGLLASRGIFYGGVLLLGLGTGLSTVTNLSLMLDMTTAGNVGLFIGAWGIADALARSVGSIMGGVIRDVFTQLSHNPVTGYVVVFGIEAILLFVSLRLLRRIDVGTFLEQADRQTVTERAALMGEAQGG
jgi:BCD family chlorophyll transporter-like MFS transporter